MSEHHDPTNEGRPTGVGGEFTLLQLGDAEGLDQGFFTAEPPS